MISVSEHTTADVLVIGSGVAGLAAALEARKKGCDVLLVSKAPSGKLTCSYYAGGNLRIKPQKVTIPCYNDSTL